MKVKRSVFAIAVFLIATTHSVHDRGAAERNLATALHTEMDWSSWSAARAAKAVNTIHRLASIGKEADAETGDLEKLIHLPGNTPAVVQSAAVGALSSVAANDAGAFDTVTESLNNRAIADAAVRALAKMSCVTPSFAEEGAKRLSPYIESVAPISGKGVSSDAIGDVLVTFLQGDCPAASYLAPAFGDLVHSHADSGIRIEAAVALKSLGAKAAEQINALNEGLAQPNLSEDQYRAFGESLGAIASDLSVASDEPQIPRVGYILKELDDSSKLLATQASSGEIPSGFDASTVNNDLYAARKHLEQIEVARLWTWADRIRALFDYNRVGNWIVATIAVSVVIVYATGTLLSGLALLWLKPRKLLELDQRWFPDDYSLKVFGFSVSPRAFSFAPLFCRLDRVLDAWIEQLVVSITRNVSPPQEPNYHAMGGNDADLRAIFSRRNAVVICGESGSGKTTFVRRLMMAASSKDLRLGIAPWRIAPVLFDSGLAAQNENELLQRVRGRLWTFSDDERPLPIRTIKKLLAKRRLLLIFDDYWTLSPETRNAVVPSQLWCPPNTLVYITRDCEELDGTPRSTIRMQSVAFDAFAVEKNADAMAEPTRQSLSNSNVPAMIIDLFNQSARCPSLECDIFVRYIEFVARFEALSDGQFQNLLSQIMTLAFMSAHQEKSVPYDNAEAALSDGLRALLKLRIAVVNETLERRVSLTHTAFIEHFAAGYEEFERTRAPLP